MIKANSYGIEGWDHFYHENLEKYITLHNIKDPKCLDCQVSKLKRRVQTGNYPQKLQEFFEIIHSDVTGPMHPSFTGKRCVLTFVDDYSRNS